jgi:hypothetical protein
MSEPSVEVDTPHWPEPMAGLFARVRYQSYLLIGSLAVILVEGLMLFLLATRASAHVYEVHEDGSAAYIGERESNLAPRSSEARHVARTFVSLLYAWNSSTVHEDAAAAINMSSAAFGEQLRGEFAAAQLVDKIRARNVRSEIDFESVDVVDQTRHSFKVRLRGQVRVFALAQYEGAPIDTRKFSVNLVLVPVKREPDRRINGLEVARLERDATPTAPPQNGGPLQ